MADSTLHVSSLGGGHGLHQTLLATQNLSDSVNAIVTVADDGGSSGRLRRELGIIPPGDLRMAMAALTPKTEQGEIWQQMIQHRFGGNGAMAGHAVGNLILAGMTEAFGDIQLALDTVGAWTKMSGRVLPVALEPLDIEAEVSGLDDDPRVLRAVRGQVAVATTPGSVRRVRLIPENPAANAAAVEAILTADVVTIGPGSWFSSVIPHLLVPKIVEALSTTTARVVVILNLSPEAGETPGFTTERHIHVFNQHAPELKVDYFLADSGIPLTAGEKRYLERAAAGAGGKVTYADVCDVDEQGERTSRHDPSKLAAAITELMSGN